MPELTEKDTEEIVITELWEKINIAREWALNHFNAKEADNPNIVDPETLEFTKPSAFVEFPEPDQMIVSPSIMGKPSFIHYYFRLSFCLDGTSEWKTKHPISGTPMPPLKVA